MYRAHRPRTSTIRIAPVLWASCAGLLYAACALDSTGLSVGSTTTSSASAAGGGGGTGGATVTSSDTVTSATSSTGTTSTSHTTGAGGEGEGGQGGMGAGGTGGKGGAGGAGTLLWQAVAPAADGTLTLPSWLTLESPGAGRTSQTGPSTMQSGFATNAARARSVDGMTWGLSLENAQTNQCFPSAAPATGGGVWFPGQVTNTVNFADGPDSAMTATEVQMTPGQYGSYTDYIAVETGSWTWSMWVKRTDNDPSYSQCAYLLQGNTQSPDFSVTTSTATVWTRLVSTQMLTTQHFATGFDARGGTINPGYDGMPVDVLAQFCQLEQGLYPSSAIVTTALDGAGTRQADSLASTDVGTILHDGFFNVEIHLAPNYALTEIGPNGHNLLYFDLDDRLVVSGTSSAISLILGGTTVLSVSQLAWARNAEVIVKAQNGPGGASLSVTGDVTGANSTTSAGLKALSPIPPAIYILGSPTGSEECADLRYLQFN
jgi:hypothetical protein